MIVLDTCALLFWTLDRGRLSETAARILEEERPILVSSISIWEIAIKAKNGKLVLPLAVEDFTTRLSRVAGVEILSVDAGLWLRNVGLAWEHRDPADRTIVALAQSRNCGLLTSDSNMRAFYPLCRW